MTKLQEEIERSKFEIPNACIKQTGTFSDIISKRDNVKNMLSLACYVT